MASGSPSPAPETGLNPDWLYLLKYALEQLLTTCLGRGPSPVTAHPNIPSHPSPDRSQQQRHLSVHSLPPSLPNTHPKPQMSPDNLLLSEEIRCSQRYTKCFKSNEPVEKGLAGISQPTPDLPSPGQEPSSDFPILLWLLCSHCCCHSQWSHPVGAVCRVPAKGFLRLIPARAPCHGPSPPAMGSMEQGQALSCPQGL